MSELFSDELGNAVLSAITYLAEDIHRLQGDLSLHNVVIVVGDEEEFDVCAVMQNAVETYQHKVFRTNR